MNITIIGSGNMSNGISTRLTSGGHTVNVVTRDALATATITDPVAILAVPYGAVANIVTTIKPQLSGKIVIDITNPLNATYDGLVTPVGSSAAEEIAKLLPADTKLVKAFNTTFASTLVAGKVAGQPLDVFIAGDDAGAKKTVSELITSSGLHAIDAGTLSRARLLEAVGLLGIMLQDTLGTNFGSAWKILS